MSHLRKQGQALISTSSMADIAFLLLTFFLMTTVIKNEKGLMLLLPQWTDQIIDSELNNRNVFSIHINSENNFLIEGERRSTVKNIRDEIKKFILNYGADDALSDNPVDAVVSLKTDRLASHQTFISALDEIQAAYLEIYAARAKISPEEYRNLDLNEADQKKLYDVARIGIPMNISIAQPTSH